MRKRLGLIIAFIGALLISGCSKVQEDVQPKADSNTVTDSNDFIAEKPVIYLYGYDNEEVTITMDLNGSFTCTYPKYDDMKGWVVTAKKDGTLVDSKKMSYNYIYWEGKLNTTYNFDKGFCIKGSDTAYFLEKQLKELRLSRKEINEFIIYWLPRMQDNTYNVISFQTKAYTDAAKINVKPAPDKSFRVFMAWYPSATPVEIEPQKFDVPSRTGKVLVEWGGAEVSAEDHKPRDLGITGSRITDEAIIEGLSVRTAEETQAILTQTVYRKQQIQAQQQQALLNGNLSVLPSKSNSSKNTSSVAMQSGHSFTDKNGQSTTFTDAEWQKLINVWAYTGQAEEMISHHTISELRQVLAN